VPEKEAKRTEEKHAEECTHLVKMRTSARKLLAEVHKMFNQDG